MAFSDDLTFTDNSAVAHTFSRQVTEPSRCTWIDTATTASEPTTVRVAHRREALKDLPGEYQDRHTVEFTMVKKDAVTGKPYKIVIGFNVQMPLTGPLTRTEIDHLRSYIKNSTNGFLVSNTLIDKLLRSEL